ncbi:hypothetical protein ACVXHB_25365 [Escherichia coli]
MAYALGKSSTCTFLTACVRVAAGGWHRQLALFGNVSDTLAFFFIAFWRSPDAFMAEHWMEIALVDYRFKVFNQYRFLPANVSAHYQNTLVEKTGR